MARHGGGTARRALGPMTIPPLGYLVGWRALGEVVVARG
jgi:hypothetical protein